MRRRSPGRKPFDHSARTEIEEADLFLRELAVDARETAPSDLFFADLMGLPTLRRPRRSLSRVLPESEDVSGAGRISSRTLVRWVQVALGRAGFGPVKVDGEIGSQTRGAVRRFQAQHRLRSDPRLLSATLHALAAATGTLPGGVWHGTSPTHRGRVPDLSTACPEPPVILDRFAFGSARLTATHRAAITRLAQSIVRSWGTAQPVHWVCLEGHTDEVGAGDSNERLGQRRADAAEAELVAAIARLDPAAARRIGVWSTTSGETEPIAPNAREEGRARNRRVEIRINRTWQGADRGSGVTVVAVRTRTATRAPEAAEANGQSFGVPVGGAVVLRATGQPLPIGNPAYTWVSADPSIATVAPVGTAQDHPNDAEVRGVTAGTTDITVTYRSQAGRTSSTTVTVTVARAAAVTRYGCHDLQRGDRDRDPSDANRPRWGGRANAAATLCRPAGAAPPANPEHVRQLQEDLRTLGFLVVGNPSGVFDRPTEWAVREFQIYAKMQTVARVLAAAPANLRRSAHLVAADLGYDAATNRSDYVASLESVANTVRYRGSVSGVVNADTRAALDHWLAQDWRCPVVIEAWSMRAGARHRPVAINLWAHDAHASSAPRMFARDFTGYYTLPAGRNADDMHVIGDFATYLTWSGPRSVPPGHTWAEGELLPAALVGNAAPAGATLSTYRVVRAVSEVECIGFFDSVNCYDNAFISVGPCHWTLGIVSARGVFSEGELCGYLAFLRHADNAAFVDAFEFFGARIDENWVSAAGPADGADLFSQGSRKYTGWVALQQENGTFARLAQTEADGNYFKTWHWHYRFVMAGRTIDGYRRRMWDMARVRIRDIRNVPWGAGVAQVGAGAAARPATIGDVFTSERGMAMLLRWHIRFPGHVISGGSPGARLRNALANARAAAPGLAWNGDPSGWTDDHERHLIAGILGAAPANVQQTLRYVRDWPNWLGGANPRGFALAAPIAAPLQDARNSFVMDAAALPPAPP